MASSNPFKNAAQKQKKAPGARPVNETPVVETVVQPAAEEKVAPAEPVVTPAPVAEVAPVVEVAPKTKPEPVDMMSFYKEQNKVPKKDEKVRKQFVIPKSIDDKLKKAMKNKEIPSENQLINDLLKNFFDGKLLYRDVE